MRPQHQQNRQNRQHSNRRRNDERTLRGSSVDVYNGDVSKAMRILKKLLIAEGVFKEMRERRFFEKPSMTRKKAKSAAKKRWQKKLAQQTD